VPDQLHAAGLISGPAIILVLAASIATPGRFLVIEKWDDADAQTKMLGFIGRDPTWTPTGT